VYIGHERDDAPSSSQRLTTALASHGLYGESDQLEQNTDGDDEVTMNIFRKLGT